MNLFDMFRRQSGSASRTGHRSRFAWPTEADVPKPNKKKAQEKRAKKELKKLRWGYAHKATGVGIALLIVIFGLPALYGSCTMGSRLSDQLSSVSQQPSVSVSPSPQVQPVVPPETQLTIEVTVQAGQLAEGPEVGPGTRWTTESNRRFVAYSVSDGSDVKGPEHEMPAGIWGWGGDIKPGQLFVRGIENDTRIKFFRQ